MTLKVIGTVRIFAREQALCDLLVLISQDAERLINVTAGQRRSCTTRVVGRRRDWIGGSQRYVCVLLLRFRWPIGITAVVVLGAEIRVRCEESVAQNRVGGGELGERLIDGFFIQVPDVFTAFVKRGCDDVAQDLIGWTLSRSSALSQGSRLGV